MANHRAGARTRRRSIERLEVRRLLAADLGAQLTDELLAALDDGAFSEVASIDGSGNNLQNIDWGAAGIELLRLTTVEYADGLSGPAGEARPSAREVSNSIASQSEAAPNDRFLTDFVWIWGQFIDHDIDLTLHASPEERLDIQVPLGDAYFDPFGTGEETIGLLRSDYIVDDQGVRQQVNAITAYLDGSVVYGSDAVTAASLRAFVGGRMLTSEGDLLPLDENGFFMAGDIRANENVALTAMHTLWVREHNRIADEIAEADPSLDDEAIYQRVRGIVVAEIQAITYNQWLPALLGINAIEDYEGYDAEVDASIANVFSTAAYRFGHSMLSSELLLLIEDGVESEEETLSLADAFFSPDLLLTHGVDSLLQGAAAQLAMEIDTQVVDEVRNFLFGPPGAGGLDLASLNIQRGRDHGLADYNQIRQDYGLERVQSFSQITSDAELASKLEQLYESVDEVDAWVGVLAEDHAAGSSLGELGRAILVDQFSRIRDGDRFWYENRFTGNALAALQSTTLSEVIQRNSGTEGLQENVFIHPTVLFYSVDPRGTMGTRGETEMMLIAQQGELRLLDARSGELLASLPSADAIAVKIVGSRGDDRVLVHPSVLALGLPGGIVVDGHGGRRDTVVLMGGPMHDSVTVDNAFAEFGQTIVQVHDIDRLVIDPGRGPDRVRVVERGDYRLVVHDDDDRPRDDRQRDKEKELIDPLLVAETLVPGLRDGVSDQSPRDSNPHSSTRGRGRT